MTTSSDKRDASRSPDKNESKRNKNNQNADDVIMEENTMQDLSNKFKNVATISTTVNEKLYDLSLVFDTDDIKTAKSPYVGFFGEGQNFFHDDQAKALRSLAKMANKIGTLSQEQINTAKTTGFDIETTLLYSISSITKDNKALDYLTEEEVSDFNIIMGRLAHTKPHVFGTVKRSKMNDSLAGRLWYSATMALGSHYVEKKAKRQTSLTAFMPPKNQTGEHKQTKSSNTNSQKNTPINFPKDNQTRSPTDSSQAPRQVTPDQTKPTSIQLGRAKKAADQAASRNHRTRLVVMFHIKKTNNKTAAETLLGLIQSMFGRYKSNDKRTILLPWLEKDMTTTKALENSVDIPTDKMSELRPFVDRARPKDNSNVWFKIHIAHDEQPVHFTALDTSDTADWFDDNGAKAYIQPLDSDDPVTVGQLVYSGPFVNPERLTELVNKMKPNLKISFRIKKNKDIPLGDSDGTRRPWALDHQQPIHIEAHRPQQRAIKNFIYNAFNRVTDPNKRLGQYNFRALPDPAFMRGGTNAAVSRANVLRKHAAVVKSIDLYKTDIIIDLDSPIYYHGLPITLRKILHALPYPLDTPEDDLSVPKSALLNSVDFAPSGQDKSRGIVYLTAYNDRFSVLEALVEVLPAFLTDTFNEEVTKTYCSAMAIDENEGDQVIMTKDDEGNWNGGWTTQEDSLLQDIIDQDVGIQLDLDGLETLENQRRVILNADDTSVLTNGTAFGRLPPADPQENPPPNTGAGNGQDPALQDSAVPAQLAAAHKGSGLAA